MKQYKFVIMNKKGEERAVSYADLNVDIAGFINTTRVVFGKDCIIEFYTVDK